jgi:hypothetical protein
VAGVMLEISVDNISWSAYSIAETFNYIRVKPTLTEDDILINYIASYGEEFVLPSSIVIQVSPYPFKMINYAYYPGTNYYEARSVDWYKVITTIVGNKVTWVGSNCYQIRTDRVGVTSTNPPFIERLYFGTLALSGDSSFNSNSALWTTPANCPTDHFGICNDGRYIYILKQGVFYRFDTQSAIGSNILLPVAGSWTQLNTPPVRLIDPIILPVGNNFLVFAGLLDNGTYNTSCMLFNGSIWELLNTSLTPEQAEAITKSPNVQMYGPNAYYYDLTTDQICKITITL